MEKIIYGQPIEKGQILEITISNIEHPIKVVVLDVMEFSTGSNTSHCECLMYAQKRLFKMSFEHNLSIEDIYDDNLNVLDKTEVHYYSDLKYEGIIVEYCEIPAISSDI